MKKILNFALIGGSGYVADKHYHAIKNTGNRIVAVLDPVDNIGILDKYEISANFFKKKLEFEKFIKKSKGTKDQIDFLTICSPNYLHYEHILIGLKHKIKIICEKPLLIKISHLKMLIKKQKKFNLNIFPILQLRFHPICKKIEKLVKKSNKEKFVIDLIYIAPRGNWYTQSWKSNSLKSGGLACNIGIHLFDILIHYFGKVIDYKIFYKSQKTLIGYLKLENAEINWILSTNPHMTKDNKAIRKIKFLNKEFNFSNSNLDLHEESYKKILNNKGFIINDSIDSLKLVNLLKNAKITKVNINNYFKKFKLYEKE